MGVHGINVETEGGVRAARAERAQNCVPERCDRVRPAALEAARRTGRGRAAAAAATSMLLCAAAVLYAGETGGGGEHHVSLAAAAASGRGRELSGKALADVKQMYAQDPQLVKEFAMLTGKSGQKLLDQIAPPKPQTHKPKVFKGPTLHTLDTYMQQLSDATEEQVRESTMPNTGAQDDAGQLKQAFNMLNTVDVNKRTAWMMINDLSQDWDKHSNYSATPWEFCAGRNLSPRQIRMCAGHLIRVAGVQSHRDLNMNAKIYDRERPLAHAACRDCLIRLAAFPDAGWAAFPHHACAPPALSR
jgi:hypothetical protein